jgi:hypothetical protein
MSVRYKKVDIGRVLEKIEENPKGPRKMRKKQCQSEKVTLSPTSRKVRAHRPPRTLPPSPPPCPFPYPTPLLPPSTMSGCRMSISLSLKCDEGRESGKRVYMCWVVSSSPSILAFPPQMPPQ